MFLVTLSNVLGTGIWRDVNLNDVPIGDSPIYAASPFSYFAIRKCHERGIQLQPYFYRAVGLPMPEEATDDEESGSGLNPYFSLAFLEYLLMDILPYQPMFDHSLMILCNLSTEGDTNGIQI